MRFALLALLLPASVIAGGAGNEGEKLYRDLEKTVGQAKMVRVAFASKLLKGGKEAGHFKGVVDLGEGDMARIEVKGEVEGKKITLEMTSDGKKMKVVATPPGKEKEEPLPRNFGAMVRTGLSRVGPTAGLLLGHPRIEGKEDPDIDKLLRVSDFKLGENAKVEGREARVIEYKVTLRGTEKASAKLWLDAKTHLPLKRELSADTEGGTVQIVESYSEFTLGRKGQAKAPPPPPK
jgi:outer membrane lipoprotein-sorting protein